MKRILNIGRNVAVIMLVATGFGQFAAVQADPMIVQANVVGSCELGTLGPADFGDLTPGSLVDKAGSGTIQYRCTDQATADIGIDDGTNGVRNMGGPGVDQIAYELYKEIGLSNRWGDSGLQLQSVTGSGMLAFDTITVFGEVTHADYADAEVGAYSDTVDVTITVN
jgi:spore coat protein U-like protein